MKSSPFELLRQRHEEFLYSCMQNNLKQGGD